VTYSAHYPIPFHRYGCRAFQTVATFVHCGVLHRARRFWRADHGPEKKIEIYTLEPGLRDPDTAFAEDWLGYAVPGTRLYAAADAALGDALLRASGAEDETAARFAALELE
jgi:hypothetical protein